MTECKESEKKKQVGTLELLENKQNEKNEYYQEKIDNKNHVTLNEIVNRVPSFLATESFP